MRVTYLDHYDSFTYNLIDWLFYDTGLEAEVLTIQQLGNYQTRQPLVISPGPHRPEMLPETMDLIRRSLGKVPILGVCLGHQCLGLALGGRIGRASSPFHGSVQDIAIIGKNPLINSISTSLRAAQYNSLVLERGSIPEEWVWAENSKGEIEGFYWDPGSGLFPALAIQFHPESFLSENVNGIREAWVRMVEDYYRTQFPKKS